MKKKKTKSKKLEHTTTKTPLSPEALKKLQDERGVNMSHHQVNYGNVVELALKMLSNMNSNLSNIARDVEELKKRK